jgi:hypothetical protein
MIGQTPAYNVQLVTSIATLPFPFIGDIEKQAPPAKEGEIVTSILFPTTHAGNSATLTYVPNSEQLEILKLAKTLRIYVWGHVNYKDAFDIPRHVLFCFRYYGAGLTTGAGTAEICDQHVSSD